MSDYTTKKELNKSLDDLEAKLSNKIDEAVTDLSKIIADFAQMVDTRFNKIESDLLELKLETRQSYSNLVSTVDGFVKRLEDYEVESRARDHEMNRIKRWVEQIAAQTGVKLEY